MSEFEKQYLNIMADIIHNGVKTKNRTGEDSYATWGQTLKFDLADGFPIITTRKVPLRIAFEETWFFLRGETDTKKLEEKNINIWKGNTTREFLDKRGLDYLPEGHMGKGYSFQWRNFGGDYDCYDHPTSKYDYKNIDKYGVDQVANLLQGLKSDPNGRRHIITGWNPEQLNEAALPPCHVWNQYQICNGKLNSSFMMRSSDWAYGKPINVMGYALLNHVFAKYLGLEPGKMFCVAMDTHLYENQLPMSIEQIGRIPHRLPHIQIMKDIKSLDDILNMKFSDIEFVTPYEHHPDFTNKPPMAI